MKHTDWQNIDFASKKWIDADYKKSLIRQGVAVSAFAVTILLIIKFYGA